MNDIKLKYQKQTRTLLEEKSLLEDQILELNTKVRLIPDLQECLKNPSNAHKRIMQWHDRLLQSETSLSQSLRDLQRLKESNHVIEQQSIQDSKTIDELYETLVRVQNEHDTRLMEWETQQAELEKVISQYEDERDRLYLSTTGSEVICGSFS